MSQEEQLKKSLHHWFGGFKHDTTINHPEHMVDLCRDIMWKEFWDRLFYKYFKDPMPGQVTSIHARHEENKQIAENINRTVYASALKFLSGPTDTTQKEYYNIFEKCVYQLNGVDVYWDGPVEAKPEREGTLEYEDEFGIRGKIYRVKRATKIVDDGGNKSGKKLVNEKFGSLEIIPFPFSAIFKYDNNDNGIMFSWYEISQGIERDPEEGFRQFKKLVEQNLDPTVVALRQLRLKLRTLNHRTVLAQHHTGISLRGTFELKTRSMNQEKEQEDPELDPYMGKLKKGKKAKKLPKLTPEQEAKLKAKKEKAILSMADMSRGFDIHVHDCELRNEKGGKCSRVCGTDQQQRMMNQIGSNGLLGQDLNLEHLAAANCDDQEWRILDAVYQSKRSEFLNYQIRKQTVLSYAFWLDIYQQVHASKGTLQHALRTCESEQHTLLRVLFDQGTMEKELDQLFANISNFNHHTLIACYWYKVWIPVMRIMENFSPKNATLDPLIDTRNPHAICYNPIDRVALESILSNKSSALYPLNQNDKLEFALETIYTIMHKLQPDNDHWRAGIRNAASLASLSIPDHSDNIPSGAQTPTSRHQLDALASAGGHDTMKTMGTVHTLEGEGKSDDDDSEAEEESEVEESEEESEAEESDVDSDDDVKPKPKVEPTTKTDIPAGTSAAHDSDSDIDMPTKSVNTKPTGTKEGETGGETSTSKAVVPATTNGQPQKKEIRTPLPRKPNNDRASCAVKMRTCMGGNATGQQDPCTIM